MEVEMADQHSPRRRGCPKGTGIDDTPTLQRVADLLVATPGLRPTTAMKRVGVSSASHLRRLQEKWKTEGGSHLEAAVVRQAERTRPAGGHGTGSGNLAALDRLAGTVPPQVFDLAEKVERATRPLVQSPAMRTALRMAGQLDGLARSLGVPPSYAAVARRLDEIERVEHLLNPYRR